MAKREMSAGIRFEILGFSKTMKNMASVHHGFFLIRQSATAASKSVFGLVQTFKLAAAAGKFEEALVAVGQISQATTKELMLLRNAAIEAGLRTQFSPQEAIEGLQTLAAMGFKAKESIKLLQPVLDLAAGSLGQLGLAQAAAAVAGTMRAFRLETSKATEVTDKLLRITQLTNFQARDFGTGLSKAAGEAGQFGQTIDDTLILMGLLRNMNLNASVSSTAVRNAVRRLASDARVRNLVESKGVQIYSKLTGKMRPVLDILSDLDTKTKTMSKSQKALLSAKVFGARGIFAAGAFEGARFTKTLADGNTVILKGMDAIKEYRKELAKSAGTAKKFRQALLNTFEGQKKLLTGVLQTAAVLAGEPFTKVLKPLVELVVNFGSKALALFRAIPMPVKKFIAGLTLAVMVFIAFGTIVIAAKVALAGLFIVLSAVNLTFLGIAATVIALGALFVGLIAIAGLVFAAFKTNFGGIVTVFERIKMAIRGTFAVMQAWKDGTSSLSKEMANDLKNAGVLDFAIRLGGFLGRAKQFFIDLWQAAKFVADPLAEALMPLALALKELISVSFEAGKKIFEAIFGPFSKLKGTKKEITGFADVVLTVLKGVGAAAKFVAKGISFISSAIKASIQPGFFAGIFAKVVGVMQGIWSFLRPIVALIVRVAINLLPTVFTIFSAVWGVLKAVGIAVGAFVIGLIGGLDVMLGGGGILPVIQTIADVFTFIVQVGAVLFRIVAAVGSFLLRMVAPIIFAIAATFGAILGTVIMIVKFIAGGLVAGMNIVISKLGFMLAPFKFIFDKISKLNPFAKKAEKEAGPKGGPGIVSRASSATAGALFGGLLPAGKPALGPGPGQRRVPPVIGAPGGGNQNLIVSKALLGDAGKDDAGKQALVKLASNDDTKTRLIERNTVASENMVKLLQRPEDLVAFFTQALINADQARTVDGYGTR